MIEPRPDRYLAPKEVAHRLDVDVETVRRWIRAGQLPAFALPGGRHHRVPESAILAMLVAERPARLASDVVIRRVPSSGDLR